MKRIAIASLLAFTVAVPALSDDAQHGKEGAAASAPASTLADGEVRKVDKDAGKLTIRHGPLPALDMPTGMTMVYQVREPALLDKVKAGDKVKFSAEKIGGAYTVTAIEPAK